MSDQEPKTDAPAAAKPAILQASQFTVEEGLPYRVFRTGAIWMNKLFFSAVVLLAVWLALGAARNDVACVDSVVVNGTQDIPGAKCTVWLTPTAKYLGAMAVLSFLASLAFGALGLMVGKRILESTPVAEEVGARREEAPGGGGDGPAPRPPSGGP